MELKRIVRSPAGRLPPLLIQPVHAAQPGRPRLRSEARTEAGAVDAARAGPAAAPIAAAATTGQVPSQATASLTPSPAIPAAAPPPPVSVPPT
jgi:hypothetical protein